MLYVIKLGFEMLNAIFFDMFDKNAVHEGMPMSNM